MVASANPEDYTNRGRIITPLKDRFGAEIRTHYPTRLDDEVAVILQEAHLTAEVPEYLLEILARFTRLLRESTSVDQRSGVSARFAVAGAETVSAAAVHRGAVLGEADPVARPVDLETVVDVLRGKVEFESGEEGREIEVLEHLLRRATADTVRTRLGGIDLAELVDAVEQGDPVVTGERITAKALLERAARTRGPRRAGRASGRGVRRRAGRGRRVRPRRPVPGAAHLEEPGHQRADGVFVMSRKAERGPHNARYGPYEGGDPLAPPVDLREALAAIGDDVFAGTSPRQALREMLRRGNRDMRGLDELAAEANRRRRELLKRNNLNGTLEEVRELLDRAVLEERKTLARALDDDARFSEMRLEELSSSTAQAVQELADYDWRSSEAREDYEKIRDLLGREMLDQRFAGMKQALEGATEEDRERIREMLADLNDLLDKHSRGEDTQEQFDEFMDKHGEYFRDNPRNVDELLRFVGAARGGRTTICVTRCRRSSVTNWMRWRSRRSVIRA